MKETGGETNRGIEINPKLALAVEGKHHINRKESEGASVLEVLEDRRKLEVLMDAIEK